MGLRRPFPRRPHNPNPKRREVEVEEPTYQLPRRSSGYVIMLRYAPGIWDFHPNKDALFMTFAAAEAAACQVPKSIEVRIYRARGGVLERVQ